MITIIQKCFICFQATHHREMPLTDEWNMGQLQNLAGDSCRAEMEPTWNKSRNCLLDSKLHVIVIFNHVFKKVLQHPKSNKRIA